MRLSVLAIVICISSASFAQTAPPLVAAPTEQVDDEEVPKPKIHTSVQRSQRDAGTALLAIGGGAAAAGGVTGFAMFAELLGCFEGGPGCPSEAGLRRMRDAAIGLVAVGVPVAIVGAALLGRRIVLIEPHRR